MSIKALARESVRRGASREAGAKLGASNALGVTWPDVVPEPQLLWTVRVAVPFTYAASKNHIYTITDRGHVAMRRESRAKRSEITAAIADAVRGKGIVHNKVWLDIFVQKPNHKGDAVNVVDLVSDAVKDAIGIDDRWFCIRRLDWQIVKTGGMLFVGIGQASAESVQACSYCGRVLALTAFCLNSRNHLGVGRECKDCQRESRIVVKARREAART